MADGRPSNPRGPASERTDAAGTHATSTRPRGGRRPRGSHRGAHGHAHERDSTAVRVTHVRKSRHGAGAEGRAGTATPHATVSRQPAAAAAPRARFAEVGDDAWRRRGAAAADGAGSGGGSGGGSGVSGSGRGPGGAGSGRGRGRGHGRGHGRRRRKPRTAPPDEAVAAGLREVLRSGVLRGAGGTCSGAVVLGDLLREPVDAIVNAANSRLSHGGGLAKQVVRVGGRRVREESDAWVATHGKVPVGDCAVTSGGDLPCRFVVHAVGPIYTGGASGEEELLRATIRRCLEACEEHACATVALPAVSGGVFGYPVADATRTIVQAVVDYMTARDRTSLRSVLLVSYDTPTATAFQNAWDAVVTGGQHSEPSRGTPAGPTPAEPSTAAGGAPPHGNARAAAASAGDG